MANASLVLRSLQKQSCVVRVIWCKAEMVGVMWSVTQADVIAVWGNDSCVAVYNSLNGNLLTNLSPDDNKPSTTYSCASFNKKSPHILAVGDLDCRIHIWTVPVKF